MIVLKWSMGGGLSAASIAPAPGGTFQPRRRATSASRTTPTSTVAAATRAPRGRSPRRPRARGATASVGRAGQACPRPQAQAAPAREHDQREGAHAVLHQHGDARQREQLAELAEADDRDHQRRGDADRAQRHALCATSGRARAGGARPRRARRGSAASSPSCRTRCRAPRRWCRRRPAGRGPAPPRTPAASASGAAEDGERRQRDARRRATSSRVEHDREQQRADRRERHRARGRAHLAGDHRHDLEALAGEDDRERRAQPAEPDGAAAAGAAKPLPSARERADQQQQRQQLEHREARPDARGEPQAGRHHQRPAPVRAPGAAAARPAAPSIPSAGSVARVSPTITAEALEERAHVGHPADQERHALRRTPRARTPPARRPRRSARPSAREGERRRQQRQPRQHEDDHGAEPRRAARPPPRARRRCPRPTIPFTPRASSWRGPIARVPALSAVMRLSCSVFLSL